MKLVRVSAVARKEFIHIVRDPRSLGMAIAIPMLLLFLFGYALALDVDRVPLMVWDQSQTPASREFLTYFTGSRYFSLQRYASGYPELERALDANEVLVGLVIPRDFAERARTHWRRCGAAIVDGSDSNTTTIAMGISTRFRWSTRTTCCWNTRGGSPENLPTARGFSQGVV